MPTIHQNTICGINLSKINGQIGIKSAFNTDSSNNFREINTGDGNSPGMSMNGRRWSL